MAKQIVVQLPQGSPLEKMKPEEIEKVVEQATAHLPKAEHAKYAEELVIKKGNEIGEAIASEDDPVWRRACRR